MTPPLPCRTHCPTIRLKIEPHDDVEKPDSEQKKKLIEILLSNPEDRIITACLHFFYAQQSDPFIQDFDSDYAHLCACLEACFDIKQSDITKKFVAKLKETYGEDRNFEQLVKGLYACRSHYVHGLSNFSEEEKTTDQRLKDYEKFVQTKGTFSIVRSMCYDVIWIQLIKLCYDDQIKDKLLFRHTNPTGLLIKLLDSTELYKTIKCYTESKKSAEKIASLSLEEQQEFIDKSEHFYKYVDWFLIAERPDVPDVVETLKVYLDVYQRIKGSDIDCNDTQTIRDLASIFHNNNMIPGESCFRALGGRIRSERMAFDFSEPYESDTQNPFTAAIVNVIYRLAVFFGTYCDLDKIGDTSSPEVVTSSPPEPQIRVAL
ncbi:hypothetical protein FACS1894214_4300 [Planctomycetales bacterium]|nr:hypothetical protein FACS1894214_4300 [Planctomycetales bacterium]